MDTFKTIQDTISAALVATTRAATRVSAADIPFQRSLDPANGTALDTQNARLLQLAERLLANAAASSDVVGPKLPDVEAIDANWKGIVDVVDSLLERADTSLDEFTGVVKRLGPGADQPAPAAKGGRFAPTTKTLRKPQLSFENVPKNNETGGFRPLISSKPHAQVPLEESLKTFTDNYGREQYPHPYQAEIESYEYPASMYQKTEPQPYTPFEDTTAIFVDTPEALAAMLEELKNAKEIAIDLEHHDNRTYIGLVSLMQISTRDQDWIVDTLVPWRRQLECLNEVFADPDIVKVLHGSYMDIIWLQRDLGLYVVGLFDTYHAARALGYPGASLSFLLDKFVNFKAQKQYQMADWRLRPLTEELLTYARADTHFLLYIFDNMRNELIDRSNFSDPEKDKISDVLNNSRETALQRYEHPIYDTELGLGSGGWYKLLTRTVVNYTRPQFAAFRAVHKWRDDVARAEDESPAYVMPNHALFSIARALPEDKTALYNVVQHVSHIVRARADELVAVIAEAKALGDDAPDMNETLKKIAEIIHQKWLEKEDLKTTPAAEPLVSKVPAIQPAPALELVNPIATLDTPPLRAPASKFWGSLFAGAEARQPSAVSAASISLAVPLPPLTAEIFTEELDYAEAEEEQQQAERPEHTFVPKEDRPAEDERTDIFIVKQLGGKRKRAAVDEDAEMDTGANANDGSESEQAREKRLKREAKLLKKERKAQDALDAAAAEEAAAAAAEDEQVEPDFDYAAAPSVLRARDADKGKRPKREKKKKEGFNPYAKMADAPKGLPRHQKETAGRSKTFKS